MGMGLFDQSDNQGAPLGQVVANQGLGKALLAALNREALINCIQGDVTGLSMVQSGADITWQDDHGGQQANFDLVIIADGAQSKLRQQLGIGVTRIDYQQHAIVANVRHSNAHQLQAFERFTERGPLALLPRGGNALSRESGLVWTCPTDELAAYKAMTSAQLLTRLQQQFGFRLGHFSAISSPSFYPLELIVADEQVRSNLVLMGNAAHFLHPVAGQGFNLSVRDSLRLVGVLQQALNNNKSLGSLEVLQHYQQKQAQDQYNTIGLSDAFNRIFTHATLPIQIMRTLGLLGLELSPTLRSHFIALLSGRAQAAI
jgi:ubiquinone biosynthesis UbiH/UbiF/VisC/COQ6 family hydroxylase